MASLRPLVVIFLVTALSRGRPSAGPWSSGGLVALLLASALLAGCLADSDGGQPPVLPPLDLSALIVQDHDHTNRSAHAGAVNLSLVGWSEGVPSGAGGTASYTEIDVWGDYVFLGRGARGGFAVIDVSNASSPRFVSEWTGEGSGDVDVSDDGNWLFVTTQRNWVPSLAAAPSWLPGYAMTAEHHLPRGCYVFDVSDKADPQLESFFPLPTNGPHTSSYFRDEDGTEYVLLMTYDLLPPPENGALRGELQRIAGDAAEVPNAFSGFSLGVNPVTQRITITTLGELPDGSTGLAPVGVYQLPGNPNPQSGPLIMPHDAVIERHPSTKELLMYVAYWDAGLVIVSLEDPANPQTVAQFTDFAPSEVAALHYSEPFPHLIDGMHVTVTAPEIVTAPETGQVTFIDTTDPANPRKLGSWYMPGDGLTVPPETPFLFSPHNFDAQDGKVYLAHYHGGVWVIDASSEQRLANPQTAGFYATVEGLSDRVTAAPNAFSVQKHNGLVMVADIGTGLYLLKEEGLDATPREVDDGHGH